MKKLLYILCLIFLPVTAVAEGLYLTVGNGIEIRADVGSWDLYHTFLIEDDYVFKSGFIYKIKHEEDFHIGIGGGITSVEHEFGRVDGYGISIGRDTIPFVQVEVVANNFTVQLFYSDTNFSTTRAKLVDPGPPPVYEFRDDNATGPGFGLFVGYRFKIL